MKKIISILALVLAMTMVMSVSAFAAVEFSVAEDAVIPEGVEVTPAADRIDVTAPATEDKYYSILLVEGDELPIVDSTIYYINQLTAEEAAETITFEVLPLLPEAGTECTLYIGSNEEDFELIAIPLVYDEEQVESYKVGDVDGNTAITIGDVTTLIDFVVGKVPKFTDVDDTSVIPYFVGDVDNNNSVTIGDVTTTIDGVVGKIDIENVGFPRATYTLPAGTTAESTYPAN